MIFKKDFIKESEALAILNFANNMEPEKIGNFVNIDDFIKNGIHKPVYKIYIKCDAVPTNKLYLGYYKLKDDYIFPSFVAEANKSAIFFSKESLVFMSNKLISNNYICQTE